MSKVFLAIGSNLGDREANCREALESLEAVKELKVRTTSSIYETDPVGGPPQGKYLNAVLELETQLEPQNLLDILKGIELDMGRESLPRKDFPRVIDLDILTYGDLVIDSENLTVPHPRMHERSFVLKGFSEIAPDEVHPVLGKTVRQLYEEL